MPSLNAPEAVTALSALGRETRLALFRLLVGRGPDGLPAGAIAERLGIPPSSLTFHLQHLHRAGLVTQRRFRRQLIYAADFAAMNGLVFYLTDNCCGRGSHAQLRGPACNPPICNVPACSTPACDPVDAAPAMPRDAAA